MKYTVSYLLQAAEYADSIGKYAQADIITNYAVRLAHDDYMDSEFGDSSGSDNLAPGIESALQSIGMTNQQEEGNVPTELYTLADKLGKTLYNVVARHTNDLKSKYPDVDLNIATIVAHIDDEHHIPALIRKDINHTIHNFAMKEYSDFLTQVLGKQIISIMQIHEFVEVVYQNIIHACVNMPYEMSNEHAWVDRCTEILSHLYTHMPKFKQENF